MKPSLINCGCFIILAVLVEIVQPTCVLDSDFGFKINCAFKKSGLFRVRNLGGLKAHASIGFSLGDELGFEQSLTNQDPSRRRSVSVKNGLPTNLIDSTKPNAKQEKRGKQNRIMMRPMAPPASRPNQAAMDKLTSLHRRGSSTMQPIIVGPTVEAPTTMPRVRPTITMAKPMPMGVPAFKPIPPKDDSLRVLPITQKTHAPLQIPQSKGPGVAYQSELPHMHNQVSKMVSQMTSAQFAQPHIIRITPAPLIFSTPKLFTVPTYSSINQFMPMPLASPPQALNIIPPPAFKEMQRPLSNSIIQGPISNFVDPVPHLVHNIANEYAYNTKKVDDYNSITGYGDDTTLKFNKEDINSKIAEFAKAGNISMEAVEAAIALRQQQLLNKYANIPVPTTKATTTTTSTTQAPVVFQVDPEPEIVVAVPKKPQRQPTTGKVMNAPREYYPVGYEKNFDDHFQSKVELPDTTFHCGDQKYFPGLYGDEGLGCMVFHVCALTDDGLVMKSFLCPESTLFDQTILKCNWWFYVDCKNTRRLYDTNIPVSKSYQLMKALTFFSSYKKENADDGQQSNPEDMEGIKEAISILENNQDSKPAQTNNAPSVQVVTPSPLVDERHNNHFEPTPLPAPVYRAHRNLNTTDSKITTTFTKPAPTQIKSDSKLITLSANLNFKDSSAETSTSISSSESRERKHRRRTTFRTLEVTDRHTTSTPLPTTTKVPDTTPTVEAVKQDTLLLEILNNSKPEKQEKLTDQLESIHKIGPSILREAEKLPEVRRFYRSSAESLGGREVVVDAHAQVVPTLVGRSPTPTDAIARLDEAVLGAARVRKAAWLGRRPNS